MVIKLFTLERITHESKYKEKYVRDCEISNGDYSLHNLSRDLKIDSRNCLFKVNGDIIGNDSIQDYNINENDLIQVYILPIDYMFFLPTLKIFADGLEHNRQEISNKNADFFNFPQELREKRTARGSKIAHEEKTNRAVSRLNKFGMIELGNEGYVITEKGLSLLNENKEYITRDEISEYEIVNFNEKYENNRNLIYFGAPGTGKSFNLEEDRKELLGEEYNENYERVTFHPDYSYANFVGSYKPVMDEDEISYDYVPGPFMRSLVKAYNNPHEPFILIIEEINRANVAAVFGDVFQLLDRDNDNVSRYPIQTSNEMRKYLEKELNEWSYIDDVSSIEIPSNLFIWATMNSADQGVFPMDTAFKRRWDFEYLDIDDGQEKIENIKINGRLPNSWKTFKNNKDSWNEIRIAINNELLHLGINEDKLMGPFFAFNEYIDQDKELTFDEFKRIFMNKVLMYLIEDAAKLRKNKLFEGVEENSTYSQICKKFKEKGFEIFSDHIQSALVDKNE